MTNIILYARPRSNLATPASASSAPLRFEPMADDDERRTREHSIFDGIRFRLLSFNRSAVLRHRLERTQEVPPLGGDLPAAGPHRR
jgi:hypothetical protein